MTLRAYSGTKTGYVPWALTQNQRGPTCAMTAISVAYRILTGWTIFPTKGHFRNFESQLFNITIEKGQENAYVLRKAAKDLDHTQAGEIVNADSLVELVGLCEDVAAEVVSFKPSMTVGQDFVESIRTDIGKGLVPIVLFHVGFTSTQGHYLPERGQKYRHWIAIFGVEEKRKWLQLDIKHLSVQPALRFTAQDMKAADMLVWNWGNPFIVGGDELGGSSALSIDWVTEPRMWEKSGKPGTLAWLERGPGDKDYQPDLEQSNVRYTVEKPTRDLDLRGYVRIGAK